MKTVDLQYFALLREERGLSRETRTTTTGSARELYDELKAEFAFKLDAAALKVAINGDFAALDSIIEDGDEIVFLPPVSGG